MLSTLLLRAADGISTLIPRSLRYRAAFRVLRHISPSFRAYADLFIHPYCDWVNWHSGLGAGAHILYGLVRSNYPSTVVEIGSARGRSTCALALACHENNHGMVFAIDPHTPNAWSEYSTSGDNFAFLCQRLDMYQLTHCCQVLRTTASAAASSWRQPIDLLFLDGDHSYDGVKTDFDLYSRWLTPNALIVFHDTLWEYHRDSPYYRPDMGVPRFVEQLRLRGHPAVTIHTFEGLTIVSPTIHGQTFCPLITISEARGASAH
jgi:predicted O-methyltransferase YrrM